MKKLMKAAQVLKQGEKVSLEKIAIPEISNTQILVKNAYSGVNYIDTYHQSGLYSVKLPFTLGSDGSGVIEEIGDKVSLLKKSDRVAYYSAGGSYAEYIVLDEKDAVKVPDQIPLNVACALMVQGMTAHYLTHDTYKIQKGDTVLVHACTGGTGSLITQLGKILGAKIIGTVGSDEKIKIAKELGVDEVIQYNKEDFEERVKSLTSGNLCQAVYDGVGKTTWEKSMRCVKKRGTVVYFGNASGKIPDIDPLLLTKYGSIYITRPKLGDYVLTREELVQRANDLFKYVESGSLKIEIHKEFSLDQANEALEEIQSRNARGKILLKLD